MLSIASLNNAKVPKNDTWVRFIDFLWSEKESCGGYIGQLLLMGPKTSLLSHKGKIVHTPKAFYVIKLPDMFFLF